MDAFIAFDKYIVKEERSSGVGVLVAYDENTAKSESIRRRNVQSFNKWMLIDIPSEDSFIDVERPILEQPSFVLDCLKKRDFLLTLFINESRKLYSDMDILVASSEDKKLKSEQIFNEFAEDKFLTLSNFDSGQRLIDFVNKRCRTHDLSKTSALLYSSGIKGTLFKDTSGQRVLIYNAYKDIVPVDIRQARLDLSKTIL